MRQAEKHHLRLARHYYRGMAKGHENIGSKSINRNKEFVVIRLLDQVVHQFV